MTRRRWIADAWDETTASLTGEGAAHLARVLRVRAGARFDVVAGEQVRAGVVTSIAEDEVTFALGDQVEAESPLPVTLLLAVFKFDRMEWAIEKATELGVERIVPVVARRSEKHLAQSALARVERWRRIAREAAQQSRRSVLVQIEDVVPVKVAVHAEPGALRLLLAEREQLHSLKDRLQAEAAISGEQTDAAIRIAVGPEGGWAKEEEELFVAEGWKPASLGPRILRAETAAIAALSTIAAWLS